MSKSLSLKNLALASAAAIALCGVALAQTPPAPAAAPAAAPTPAAAAPTATPAASAPPVAAPTTPVAAPEALPPAAAADAAPAAAANAGPAPDTTALPQKSVSWSFDGPFGMYDRASLQRGFQVYKEVCSACHALKHIAFRNLAQPGGPGFTEAEVKALAASYMVPAGPNDTGETVDDKGQPLTRPAIASDIIPGPFANDQAARAANNGALPPDLSTVVKARKGGPNYVYSLLTGFGQKPPANEPITAGLNYNPYFEGHQIAMAQPLNADSVTFADGTKATIDQEAHDVATFLTWASEPKMDERKQLGTGVLLFLFAFAGLLYFAYRKMWSGLH